MADETPTQKQNEPEVPGAPELSKGGSRAVPQLVKYTKATTVEPSWQAPVADESSETDFPDAKLDDEAPAPIRRVEPVMGRLRRPAAANSWEESENLNQHVDEPSDPDGVVARERQPLAQTAVPKAKKRHPILKFFIWLLVLVAATIGVYWYGSYKAEKDNKQSTNQVAAPAVKTPAKPADTSTRYDSTNFGLNFSYPTSWKLTDTAAKLTLASPSQQLPKSDGTSQTGQVVLMIQPKQPSIAGFPSTGAVAALASSQITYGSPSHNQRSATYLSYLSYDQASNLQKLFITGDTGYQQGQAVPQTDITPADPLISISFATCANDTCTTGTNTPVTLAASKWQSLPVAKTVTDILTSVRLD